MTTFPDRHELGLARRAVTALGDAKTGLLLADVRAALGLPRQARKIRQALAGLVDLGIVEQARDRLSYRLVRKPAPGELRLAPRQEQKDVSVLVDVLAVVDLDERYQLHVELRSRGSEQFVAARTYAWRNDEWTPTRRAIYAKPGDMAALAEAFGRAAARVEQKEASE